MTGDGLIVGVCAAVIVVAVPAAVWDKCREKYRAVVQAAEHITRTTAKEHTP